MRISEVTLQDVKDYLRIEHTEEDSMLSTIIESAKAHIKTYTGLTTEQINTKDDLTIALYVIASEMYENRVGTDVGNRTNKFNELLDRILGSHSVNLL